MPDFMAPECAEQHLFEEMGASILILQLSVYLCKTINRKTMNYTGIIVGLATFLIIGIFHPIVIKAEYYLGAQCWWMFLLAGLGFGAGSLLISNMTASIILGVTAFSSFWSILEVRQQKERVRKGWFPEGPGHRK